MSGYIKLYRGLTENPLWNKEPFSAGQAWIDLLLAANFKDSVIYIRKTKIRIGRGQLAWSQLTMAKRWKWSRNRVARFLKDLEEEGMIEQQTGHLTTITSICNYEKYQAYDTTGEAAGEATGEASDGAPSGASDGATGGAQYKKGNKGKKENKGNKGKSETTLPDDFEVTDAMRTWFSEQGFTIDLDQATDRWKDAMIAKGRTYKDWTAAWRNGMKLAQGWYDQRREKIQPVQSQSRIQRTKIFPGHNPQLLEGEWIEDGFICREIAS
ncbi:MULTISPECIES: hypothetical protein [unclassified Marinobacter]|uniref:hypothetical protein n=1 Tax=unclassified Marinobacter TaxID=83889 RepID=UPI001925D468|nr:MULTISPECIES: hypothetical protein [unclassified Marinobacter]MBL3825132.1 hypothetical protein [Marinobacter sp. MC3]MBL3893664.1 hypothetical protein [Marinobacter sp. MW3]